MAEKPLVAAVALRRQDGRVLLVRHAGPSSGADQRWTLPAEPVRADEVAEEAMARLLRDRLHLASNAVEFDASIALPRAIANVFLCTAWSGEPQYSADDYLDAAWAPPSAPGGIDVVEGVRDWLGELPAEPAARRGDARPSAEELIAELATERAALLDAYLALDEAWRDVSLDDEWAPVDLIAHCATVEAYYAAEARALLETPGHTWRPFNTTQDAAVRAGRVRPSDDRAELARLEAVRAGTLEWVESLGQHQLDAFGNHADRGAVRVGERIAKIASHDRAHAAQLAKMLAATEAEPDEDDDEDTEDAVADR